jgi:hypothetical protein
MFAYFRGMTKTLEYEILSYLNSRIGTYTIVQSDLEKHLHGHPANEIERSIKDLKDVGYVSNKTDSDKAHGLTITEEGQKRYGRLHTEITEDERKEAVDWIKRITLGFAAFQLTISFFQYCENRKANEINQERNNIATRSLQIDSISKINQDKSGQLNSESAIRLKDTSLIRLVKLPIKPRKKKGD